MADKYVVIDTETTGLFDFTKPADAPGQPRLCGVTFLVVGGELLEATDETTLLIKPDGWVIEPGAAAVNGLTTEQCEREGVPIDLALTAYEELVGEDRVFVAYNAQHDLKVMRAELRRAGRDDLFAKTRNICTMRPCRGLSIEKANGKKGQPQLSDAYRHFTGTELIGGHRSAVDALACLVVFRGLRAIGACPDAAVHYAKNAPEGRA